MIDGSAIYPTHKFTLEQRLALEAVRSDSSDAKLRELATSDVEWDALRQTAIWQGVLPLVYSRLKAAAGDLVPVSTLAELRSLYIANAQRNYRLTRKLLKALAALASRGIEAVPFKGPALAVQAYGDVTLRSFSDLDLLICHKDLSATRDLLAGLGYHPEPEMDSPDGQRLLISDNEYTFSDGDASLDVHWNITEKFLAFRLEPQLLWDGLDSCLLMDKPVRVLSPENTLLMLCINGVREEWRTLKPTLDVSHLCSAHPGLDYSLVLERAQSLGACRIVALGLRLAEELAGLSLPDSVHTWVGAEPGVAPLVKEVFKYLFSESQGHATFAAFYRRSRERLLDRIVFSLTPNPKDWSAVTLPTRLRFLYYAVRPLRLMAEFCQSGFRWPRTG